MGGECGADGPIVVAIFFCGCPGATLLHVHFSLTEKISPKVSPGDFLSFYEGPSKMFFIKTVDIDTICLQVGGTRGSLGLCHCNNFPILK